MTKKLVLGFLLVALVCLGVATVARAQGTAIVKVPFPFIAGERLMPAGSYRIAVSTDDPGMISITGTGPNAPAAFFAVSILGGVSAESQAQVSFKRFHGQAFLWRVSIPGTDVREAALRDANMNRLLVKLNLSPAEPVLGASAK